MAGIYAASSCRATAEAVQQCNPTAAQTLALILPLLRDTNSIVRNRAFDLLRTVSSQELPQTDPAQWDQWWAANKATFVSPKPQPGN
jgi:hypothetical protein